MYVYICVHYTRVDMCVQVCVPICVQRLEEDTESSIILYLCPLRGVSPQTWNSLFSDEVHGWQAQKDPLSLSSPESWGPRCAQQHLTAYYTARVQTRPSILCSEHSYPLRYFPSPQDNILYVPPIGHLWTYIFKHYPHDPERGKRPHCYLHLNKQDQGVKIDMFRVTYLKASLR